MNQYTTKSGDVVDEIAWNFYGTRAGLVVEQVLDANKGLAAAGPVLAAGIVINLPDISLPAATQGAISLWD